MRKFALFLLVTLIFTSCATGRDLSSPHYLPKWKNNIFNFPSPSETSSGYWVTKTASSIGKGVGRILLFPFAILGNVAVNAYYVPTWPFRWAFRGDKRLLVWYPIFDVGKEVGSSYYSTEWNKDLA